MNIYTASYNYPNNFLWGVVPDDDFPRNKDSLAPYIYQLREWKIGAVLIRITWPNCEPLKGNYNEAYIDMLRLAVSRIHSQNIEPVILLDTSALPQWQNLDHPKKADGNFQERREFVKHLIDALIPYTNFFCIRESDFSDSGKADVELFGQYLDDISMYMRNISDSVKLGLSLPESFWQKTQSRTFQLFKRNCITLLKSAPIDFFGLTAEIPSIIAATSLFPERQVPLMFLSDKLRHIFPELRTERLADNLFEIWSFYQRGCPILGYFSETEISTDTPHLQLFRNACENNAFAISTQASWLPQKWVDFLKS